MTTRSKGWSFANGLMDVVVAMGEGLTKANEAQAELLQKINEHNDRYPSHKIVLATKETPKECGPWTVLADCSDTDCFRHYQEKRRAARAT